MTAFLDLEREISRVIPAESFANRVAWALAKAVKERHGNLGDRLLVNYKDSSFDLLERLGMTAGGRYITDNKVSDYYTLNQKAIDTHIALCQEGFYGFDH